MLQNPQLLQSMDQRVLQTYMFLMGMTMPQNMPGSSGTSARKTGRRQRKRRIEKEEKEKAAKEREEILKNETRGEGHSRK